MDADQVARGSGALSLTVEHAGSGAVVRMAGDFDLANVGRLMAALDRLDLGNLTRLVIDLQGVEFLDASGLGCILRANERCLEESVPLTVIKPRGLASRVFTLTRAHRELEFAASPAAQA